MVFGMTTYGIHQSEQDTSAFVGDAWVGTALEQCSGRTSRENRSERP